MHLFRTDRLWIAFLVALVPLVVLLVFQYAWLRRYEELSTMAFEASVAGAIAAVRTDVEQRYRNLGEELLTFAEADLASDGYERIRKRWMEMQGPEVRRLFLADYRGAPFGRFLYYNPDTGSLEQAFASSEALAVIVACSPFQIIRSQPQPMRSTELVSDASDPSYDILVRPIVDADGIVVAVAGAILDETTFQKDVLPAIVAHVLPVSSDAPKEGIALRVEDANGVCLFGPEDVGGAVPIRTGRFSFVFTDWAISLYSLGPSPLVWERTELRFSVVLSAVLALVLLAGVLLALQAAKREMRVSQMKADFVSNVSHELRTPVASIRVFADLLRSGRVGAPEKIVEYGERIEAESRRLSNLIEKILEFSRMESGQKTYTFVPMNVVDIVTRAVESFGHRPVSEGFDVRIEPSEGAVPEIIGDADALSQAIDNLLENAAKYSRDRKEIRVRVSASPRGGANDGVVRIEVQDYGIGIEPSEQKRIFERFHRVPTHGVHDVKGSGLGLSIVQEIVRVHGGHARVESEPGAGSKFRIELPFAGPEKEST
ncbi:MAG: HAMP domain-containing sensor histidine kinase [Candidatus Eisenbacteria bacterium]